MTTAIVTVPAVTGVAVAHFPPGLTIDIKPVNDQNPINPKSRGLIPIAVHQTDEFDPTSEDVRYRFEAPGAVAGGDSARPTHGGHIEDVNGDGHDDLVRHFPTNKTGFDGDESEG